MSIFSGIRDFLSGDLFKTIKDTIQDYYPPDLTPQQKAELDIKMAQMLHEKEIKANQILSDSAAQLDKRIAEQEGTASDLKQLPLIGRIVLFLRGMQRPVWGFATLYIDFKWFFEDHSFTEQQQTALIAINILVLTFLFGERTLKNLEPLIVKVFGKVEK